MTTVALRVALTLVSAILLGGLGCSGPVSAQSVDASSANFVARLNAAVTKAVNSAPGDPSVASRRVCEDISASSLDLNVMMQTASAGYWERMDAAQRDAYRVAFMRRLIKDCVSGAGAYLHGAVEIAGQRQLPSGEKIIGTRSRAQEAEAAKILMWQVRPHESGKLMITDVLIDGRSAMLSLREQAAISLERSPGDVAALVATLER